MVIWKKKRIFNVSQLSAAEVFLHFSLWIRCGWQGRQISPSPLAAASVHLLEVVRLCSLLLGSRLPVCCSCDQYQMEFGWGFMLFYFHSCWSACFCKTDLKWDTGLLKSTAYFVLLALSKCLHTHKMNVCSFISCLTQPNYSILCMLMSSFKILN